jgi:predicted ABC-type transport system involved in lysophospholipase L1 biosynthesis ATPase subunit
VNETRQEPLISLEHVSKTYHMGQVDVHALKAVELDIARALAKDPSVLLCGEPAGNADSLQPTGTVGVEAITLASRSRQPTCTPRRVASVLCMMRA